MNRQTVNRQSANRTEKIWAHFKQRAKGESNPSLRNRIATEHYNVVRKEAHKAAANCAVDYADLEQIGMIGILKAIERFDPTRGVAFTSFAVPYIRGEMLHYLRSHGSNVKVPRRMREENSRAKSIERRWVAQGQAPTEQALAQEMGCSIDKLRLVRTAIANQMALPLKDEICEIPAAPDTYAEDVERHQQLERTWKQVRQGLNQLEPEQQELIQQVYLQGLTRKAIARQFAHCDWRGQLNRALQQISNVG